MTKLSPSPERSAHDPKRGDLSVEAYGGLPATTGRWKDAFHPDDIDTHVEKWRASLASGQPLENEARLRRAADGEYRWFLILGAPLHDGSGNILRWYGIATDIEDGRRRGGEAPWSRGSELQELEYEADFARSPISIVMPPIHAEMHGPTIRRS